jgi:uncharacterized hydrophobic protein (TIGR00271 family)
MSIAALITDKNQIEEALSWGKTFAASESTNLLLVIPQKSKKEKNWIELHPDQIPDLDSPFLRTTAEAISAFLQPAQAGLQNPQSMDRTVHSDEQDDNVPATSTMPAEEENQSPETEIKVMVLQDPQPGWTLVKEIQTLQITLLLLPVLEVSRNTDEENSWQQSLYQRAPCETLQMECKEIPANTPLRVLIAVTGNQDDSVALQRGVQLAAATGGNATAMLVQPAIDEVAKEAGEASLNKIIQNTLGRRSTEVSQKVVLANNLVDSLSGLPTSDYDLILAGTRRNREINQLLLLPTSVKRDHPIGIAAIRKPIPLTNLLLNQIQRFYERFIPQLSREQRIGLVQRIQNNSQWDFDFMALIFLSTLIASLGLIRNSASVVIGAMLVAPLMTPIVGTGLAIAQGNIQLIANSLRTILKGFATAFLIALILGMAISPIINSEMAARGEPNFLDLVVALASGIAAAYALGRPNLLSALPGVAIAAALVPPVATSGMALAMGYFQLAAGSLLLFLTNIVAITLGTTFTFSAVGIRSHQKGMPAPTWPILILFLLVLISVGLIQTMNLSVFSGIPA